MPGIKAVNHEAKPIVQKSANLADSNVAESIDARAVYVLTLVPLALSTFKREDFRPPGSSISYSKDSLSPLMQRNKNRSFNVLDTCSLVRQLACIDTFDRDFSDRSIKSRATYIRQDVKLIP